MAGAFSRGKYGRIRKSYFIRCSITLATPWIPFSDPFWPQDIFFHFAALGRFCKSLRLAATDAIVQADLKSQPDATTNSGTSFEPPHGTIAQVRRIASLVTDAVSEQDFSGKHVLWVDDKPEGNQLEIIALTALGLQISEVTTTEQGISELRARSFDVVISDMKRGTNDEAGFDLLGLMLELPILVRVSTKTPHDSAEHLA